LLFWQTATGKVARVPVNPQVPVNALAWSRDGKLLASGDGVRPGGVQIWTAEMGFPPQRLCEAEGHPDGVSACVWSADGKVVATGGADGTVRFWRAQTGQAREVLRGHTAAVSSLSWRQGIDTLACAGRDGTVLLGPRAGPGYRALLVPLLRGQGFALRPEGDFAVSRGAESSLVLVVQTEQGQGVYSPAAFCDKFGWKNEPDRLRLDAK
jgi:hypothetical protein